MRGTMKITNSTNLHYLRRNYANLSKVDGQIAAERQVVRPEDDPLSTNVGLKMLNIISRTKQYSRNINTGLAMLTQTDQSLGLIKTEVEKIKNLTTGGAHDPTTASGRQALSYELQAILQQMVVAANSYNGERYLYGGQYTKSPPFNVVNNRYVNYLGDDRIISILSDFGVTTAVNSTGKDAFGSMETVIGGGDMNPSISLSTDRATRLSDLNGGSGVPKGKVMVYYSAYPNGLEVDLSGCDTLEDVKDAIEKQTLDASRNLNPADNAWLDNSNLNWRDLTDRYVKVTMNPEHNGISLQEFDLGEPLPPPTDYESLVGVDYSGAPGYPAGGGGRGMADPSVYDATYTGDIHAVYDKYDYVYGGGARGYSALRVDDVASNKVAEGLGIKGSAQQFAQVRYVPGNPPTPQPAYDKGDPVLDGRLHGRDLNPKLSSSTLLADLEGYNGAVYTFTNGTKPGEITVEETSADSQNIFNSWNLSGISLGDNTGPDGELYAKVTRRPAPDNDLYVEVYTVPLDKAKPANLVATGSYSASSAGGTVKLSEANSSGISGSVGIVLSPSTSQASVSMKVNMGEQIQSSIYVPAFVVESNLDGSSKDKFNIASGWQIQGLDKPPATGYDQNHPASTDLDGDISVNYRYDAANNKFIVELYRPSFSDQPAKLIATGSLDVGSVNGVQPTEAAVSGRIALNGVEGFEQVTGSVYIELPVGVTFTDTVQQGTDSANPTQITYQIAQDSNAGTLALGGAFELINDMTVGAPYRLAADTLFKAGQTFDADVYLPNGGVIRAGTVLSRDMLIPKGVTVTTDNLLAGTVLPEGQRITFTDPIPAGSVIPRGTYYDPADAAGFPADGMGMTVTSVNAQTGEVYTESVNLTGYDLTATFATIEDFNRAVAEAGVYVTSRIAENGRSLEFISTLAGAYLTVSEDTDCYEQMNDKYQQLSGLELTGLVKGVNSDANGNVYTEIVYYPPNNPFDPNHPKVTLISDDGTLVEVDPGYYVRVYSDKDALNKSFENRDNSSLVAEGFLAPGEWNPAYVESIPLPADSPFIPTPPSVTLGSMKGLVLEERNNSGVNGMVDLDYYGNQSPQAVVKTRINPATGLSEEYVDYDPWKNDEITIFPGGLRTQGSRHTTIQEFDLVNIQPGANCDSAGTFHGSITRDNTTVAGIQVTLHKDASHAVVTARNDPALPLLAPGNVVQLYETNAKGEFILVDGQRVPAGTMVVDFANLPDGTTDKFTLTTGAARNGGQERAVNVFSTINDILDALAVGDLDALHNLLGSTQKDMDRLLEARASVSSRSANLELTLSRQSADLLNFETTLTERVGMDTDALSAAILRKYGATNAYEAAQQIAASIMQMSLLDYLR